MRTPLRKSHGKITFVLYNKPYSCGGKCLYCFRSKGFTKSTTPNEDTSLAKNNDWSGYLQLKKRFENYDLKRGSGIKCDLAVKGDSFASHNEDYLRQYTKELYDFLNGCESESLAEAAMLQEFAPDRCVTYKVETRPDQIDDAKCRFFMELGITTVEIGVQSLDDEILSYNKRGHGTETVRRVTRLLRKYGFEVVYQMMVGLPGSSWEKDRRMLSETLWREEYSPDAIKVYPCLLLRKEFVWQEPLRKLYYDGTWNPMTVEEYIRLWQMCYPVVPSYVHINRIQRIIPAEKIEEGAAEEIDRAMFDSVSRCLWQRSPAQRLKDLNLPVEKFQVISYAQGVDRECFEAVFEDDVVAGYARLDRRSEHSSMIRDVRVLGNMLGVGCPNLSRNGFQHVGIGTSLLKAMIESARSDGHDYLFVRPSFGMVAWFKKRGFVKITEYFYVKYLNGLPQPNKALGEIMNILNL